MDFCVIYDEISNKLEIIDYENGITEWNIICIMSCEIS